MKKLRDILGKNILFAQFVSLSDLSRSPNLSTVFNSSGDLTSFVNGLFKFAISVGAILAVLRIAYAGYLYMGQNDMWSSKGKAKEIIGNVTLGLLLLLAIYLILFQINPDIVKLTALKNIKPIPQSGAPAVQQTQTNPLFGGVGGAANIQRDSSTGNCYIVNPNTGGLDPTACP